MPADFEAADASFLEDVFVWFFFFLKKVKFSSCSHSILIFFLFSKQIKECADEPVGKGFLVSCLVDHRGNITEYQCHQYITKMTAIIFSDYRLICGFMDDCKADINLLKCGSIRPGEKVSREQVDCQ